MDLGQFRTEIVQPTLLAITLWSSSAEELLIATAMHESAGLTYIRQLPRADGRQGPALGFFQIEPATAEDLVKRYIFQDKTELGKRLRIASQFEPWGNINERLLGDMRFGCIIARLKYWSAPPPLPRAGDVPAMAAYWARWYNTRNDPETIQQFIANHERWLT